MKENSKWSGLVGEEFFYWGTEIICTDCSRPTSHAVIRLEKIPTKLKGDLDFVALMCDDCGLFTICYSTRVEDLPRDEEGNLREEDKKEEERLVEEAQTVVNEYFER